MCQRDIALRACVRRLRKCLCVVSVLADVPLPSHVPLKPSTRITTVVLIIAHRNGLCLRKRGLSPAERLSFTASAVPNTHLLRLLSLVHPCTAGADELSSHAEEKEKQSNDCNIIGQVNLSVHRGRRRTNHGGAASTQRTTLPRRPEVRTRCRCSPVFTFVLAAAGVVVVVVAVVVVVVLCRCRSSAPAPSSSIPATTHCGCAHAQVSAF